MADSDPTINTNLYVNPFSMTLIDDRFLAMLLIGFIALIITYILNLDIRLPNCFYKILPSETFIDRDVMEERHRILYSNEINHDILQAKNLTKCFRRVTV
ncbi:unnamed protein product [Rotaria sp. Silwood2]|nr:unnamed protein product [Rotaria sp. Silwood2]CAF4359636.1 unnamed protein product [Rotaria sp. Silwood2]